MNKIKRNKSTKSITYKDSGVNIDVGNKFVKKIKPLVSNTRRKGMVDNIGGFGGLFDISKCGFKNPILVSATDGVGTKLILSEKMNKFDTIGIDLVAMSVNDIVVQGAEPLFFLDYFATAELPSIYNNNFDLAGFAVGAVEKNNLLPKNNINPGDIIIGLQSSGIHSNGFSLVRKILKDKKINLNEKISEISDVSIGYHLLEPTKIYVNSILKQHYNKNIKACAHITGGGILENLPRIIPNELCAIINGGNIKPNKIFSWLKNIGNISIMEMLRTFNCGIGMCVITSPNKANKVLKGLKSSGEKAYIIGHLEHKHKDIIINNKNKIFEN